MIKEEEEISQIIQKEQAKTLKTPNEILQEYNSLFQYKSQKHPVVKRGDAEAVLQCAHNPKGQNLAAKGEDDAEFGLWQLFLQTLMML